MLYHWPKNIQDALFPPTCLCCGADGVASLDLCRGCWRDLPQLGPRCRHCAMPLAGAPPGAVCGRCQQHPPSFTADALFLYAWPVDGLLQDLKYRRRVAAARTLGGLLGLRLRRSPGTTLVPIPLHPRRQRRRGFNQAEELARAAARVAGMRLGRGLLRRHRHTADQIGLDAVERRRNMRGVFAVAGNVPPSVCLIDDVMTTGATLGEAAATLRRAGAAEVRTLTVARATGKA